MKLHIQYLFITLELHAVKYKIKVRGCVKLNSDKLVKMLRLTVIELYHSVPSLSQSTDINFSNTCNCLGNERMT